MQSLDTDQLKGKGVDAGSLNGGNCKPLDSIDGKPIYPCGLIANSLFNGEGFPNKDGLLAFLIYYSLAFF